MQPRNEIQNRTAARAIGVMVLTPKGIFSSLPKEAMVRSSICTQSEVRVTSSAGRDDDKNSSDKRTPQ